MPELSMYMTPPSRPIVSMETRVTAVLGESARQAIKTAVHHELIRRMDLEKLSEIQSDEIGGRQRLLAIILQLIGEQSVPLSTADRDLLAQDILDEVFGLGPLESLLHDPTVNDILVNTYSTVYVERRGVIEKTAVTFKDEAHLMHIIDKIVSAVGRRIDESSPMVDARLLDGSRVNIVIPPLAVDGPLLSIRRFGATPLAGEDLLRFRALTPQMLEILRCAVRARLNIVVSGGTGSGKTTLLNVLSGFISPAERIVTIEDSAELQIKQEHVARLECRPPNLEGRGAIRQRELVINALRMRPDRIILGEVRGEEALDMLQAMNTGHDGSITTIHANNPRDAIARIETMAMMGSITLPEKAIRAQIASAVDLIVQVSRMSDGSRRITHISEITGATGDMISLQDIYLFEKLGLGPSGNVKGRFYSTGIVPKFAERLKAAGIPLGLNLLDHSVEVGIGELGMALLVLTFVLTLGLSFAVLFRATRPARQTKSVQQRLVAIQQPVHLQKAGAGAELEIAQQRDYAARLGRFLQNYEVSKALQVLLTQADSTQSVGGIVLACAGTGAGCGLIVLLFTHLGWLATATLPAGALLPYAMLKLQRARRLKAFNTALPDAIDLLARALRAGHSISSAIELIAEQSPAPLGPEFGQVYQQQKFGLRFREALVQMTGRIPSRDLQFLVTAILVQKETGGDLTEILDRTSHVIRERVRIEGEVRTHTAQGRLTGWILGLLPVIMLALINIVSPGYSTLLFHDPTGQKLLYAGAALILVGGMVIRKVVDVQV